MKFYTVSNEFISQLKKVEDKVRDNKTLRPYVGVVIEVGEFKYLSPLTSHKPKHDKIKSNNPLIFKIHEVGDESVKLGMLQLNNMIPVIDTEIELLNIEAQSPKYKGLLEKQQKFLRKNQEEIKEKAKELREKVIENLANKENFLVKMSCDFEALEKAVKKLSE
ncbi:type III toxin-antitoxin system ToxN/AbiQ family toxin [Vibrio cholerae]|uniref:type III toxin-antitoxin system ToxN/AbiQ family toxin n=2 Tax=Vibrio cholerae TaxID=666 RepID=UPI001593984B|nr:type III toxin-antitoxin system ToxN/AbiQ family toxin [Vibrio cholerae]ELZ1193207.1 type III toxin-antitoxin system ToxN/AbiQ family toxin [Vibrio cholerae]HDL9509968.1 type III toxin-antitoxin system ToxN/AbiQ family toxin [Vibrio cholerae]